MVAIKRIAMLAAVLWGFSAWFSWTYFKPPVSSRIVSTARHDAAAQTAPVVGVKPALELLKKSDIWGVSRKSASASVLPGLAPALPAAEIWARVAVVNERSGAFVVLRSPAGDLKSFKVGDTLPDGGKLQKISTASVEVRTPKGRLDRHQLLE